ncbi:hypothetical protein L7F22_025322 [Adiantum nelumboides]|nr:hypothetical protein [Adiantum nelumboides]
MTSLFWKALFENMGTTLKFSSSFHPQTDGQSEEANSIVLDLLKCCVSEHKATWEHYLPLVEYAYNNTMHTSTGKAPFEIVEGGKKVPPILQTKDKIFEADKYVQNMDEAYRKKKIALEKTQSKQKKAADRHLRELVFSLGDWVLLRFEKARLRKMKGKERLFPKLGMRYNGPFQQLQQAARDSLVEGLPTVRSPTGICEPCQLGKQHRVAFPKEASTRASAPLALVHTDLCGPMSTSSLSGLCYMLVLVDDFSRYTWVSFLKLRSEAFGSIRDWKAMVEKEKDLKVKSIRSDRGGEFLSENFARWCKSEGIRRQLTTPYTPSQNGVVERKNKTIMEMARAMLAHASLPRSYWAEACNTAVYIQNCSPTHALQDMTPFQAYYGRKPTVSHFRVFGCLAFVHIPKEKRQKLDFKSRKLLFLGYSAESDAYRLYDPDTRTTTVSRDVVFDESFITSAEGAAAQPIPILPPPSLPDPPASPVITPSTSHPVPSIQPPDVSPDHALSDSDSDLDVADATPEVDLAPPRREKRIPGWVYSTVSHRSQ